MRREAYTYVSDSLAAFKTKRSAGEVGSIRGAICFGFLIVEVRREVLTGVDLNICLDLKLVSY